MIFRSFVLSLLTAAILVGGGLTGASARQATPATDMGAPQDAMLADTFGLPELQITLTDGGFEGVPAETAAGLYAVTFSNDSSAEFAAVDFVQLPEGRTIDDVAAFAQAIGGPPEGEGEQAEMASPVATEGMDMASPPAAAPGEDPFAAFAWLYETYMAGGPGAAMGQTVQGIVELQPGDYAVFDDAFGPATPVAMTVTGDPMAASPVAGTVTANATVTQINTADGFDFQVAGSLTAGQNTIQIVNDSDQPHFTELIFSPSPITEEQVEVLLTFDESLGTPLPEGMPNPEELRSAAYAATQSAGSTQYLAANLEPGFYILLCFVPDPARGGIPHAYEGMYEIVEVA